MAPGFLKELRRRSKASIRTERSTEPIDQPQPRSAEPFRSQEQFRTPEQYQTDSSSDASRGTAPTTGSTTGSLTPPSNHGSDPALDTQHHQKTDVLPMRPPPQPWVNSSNRNSVSGMGGLGAPSIHGHSNLPKSEWAPRILNAPGRRPVHQKAFLLFGTIGDPSRHTVDDGYVIGSSANEHFPSTSWPVHGSHWKAVVYLEPGNNELKFTTWSSKLANNSSSNSIHTTYLNIFMVPPHCAPPLQLAILVAKDSPEAFDAVPARIEKDGNGLPTAIRKYRTAAYLWQAFTTEQMRRHNVGPRSFVFEEEWTRSTSHIRDRECGVMRSEARIHIIRTDKTVAELRALQQTQQGDQGRRDVLFDTAAEAVQDYFKPLPGEKRYVSVLLLDSHWDKETQQILGHTATNGKLGELNLAVFGSHCLQSYPNGLDEVPPAFDDCTRTDTDLVANDGNFAGSSWEAASFGLAAHLREVFHMFGCSDQVSGIMSGDLTRFNRTFTAREPLSTRTRSKAGLVLQSDETNLHRLDALRLRFHPCFRLPRDTLFRHDNSVQAYPVEVGRAVLKARSGLTHVEIWAAHDQVCEAWVEVGSQQGVLNHHTLSEQEVKDQLPVEKRKSCIRLKVFSGAGGFLEIADFKRLVSKESIVKLTAGPLPRLAYRNHKVGGSSTQDSEMQEVVFESSSKPNRIMTGLIAYHDDQAMHGIEFLYDDTSTQLLGTRAGKEGGSSYELDLRRGEYITGFYVRAGEFVAGLGAMTSLGQYSPIFGNPFSGAANNMIPPRGFSICGVNGSSGTRLENFGVLITQ